MTGGTCGALAGGMLALGSRYGRERAQFANRRFGQGFRVAKQLYERLAALPAVRFK